MNRSAKVPYIENIKALKVDIDFPEDHPDDSGYLKTSKYMPKGFKSTPGLPAKSEASNSVRPLTQSLFLSFQEWIEYFKIFFK